MRQNSQMLEKIKNRLRGTIIHRVYALLRYEAYIIIIFKIYYNAKRGNIHKINHLIKHRINSVVHELPKSVAIDIVSCCNLRCPLCSVPPYITKQADNFMPFEDFKKIVDAVHIACNLSLVYAGEPFLHPNFFDMVKYCSERYYTTTITNGTLLSSKNIEKLLDSGLDFLQISFDGFSRESYEKYRVGANFGKVKGNIVNLLRSKKCEKRGLPHTTITYLINAYNEDELNKCERFFLKAGAERFFAKAINLNVHRRTDGRKKVDLSHWLPRKNTTSLYEQSGDRIEFKTQAGGVCKTCLTPIIRCDGELLLCCHDIFNKVKIGNVFKQDFKKLWFGNHYRKLRRLAKNRKLQICKECGK